MPDAATLPPRLRRLTFNSLAILRLLAAQSDDRPLTRQDMSRALNQTNGLYREISALIAFGYVVKERLPSTAGRGLPRGQGLRYRYRVTAEGQRARLDYAKALLGDVI